MKAMHMPFDPVTAATESERALRARLAGWLVDDAPAREEARRRIRSKPGLIASLSPEALEYIRGYDGPENIGPPGPQR